MNITRCSLFQFVSLGLTPKKSDKQVLISQKVIVLLTLVMEIYEVTSSGLTVTKL